MPQNHDRMQNAEGFFSWRASNGAVQATTGDDDLVAEVDEPPEHLTFKRQPTTEFIKSAIRPTSERKESLLTRALHHPEPETTRPNIQVATDLARRRSTLSNASAASTADLTSDGGITSPARTDTPSPPLPGTPYMSFAPYTMATTATKSVTSAAAKEAETAIAPTTAPMPKPDPAVEALVKKRCISFACGGQKPKAAPEPAPPAPVARVEPEAPKKRLISFACPGPKAAKPAAEVTSVDAEEPKKIVEQASPRKAIPMPVKVNSPVKHSRSPSFARKSRTSPSPHAKTHRDSNSTIRQCSQSPTAVRPRRPNYISANSETLRLSEATRFHEFASDEPQEDDWIRRDESETKEKLTIRDTLKKENAIRQLGEEAEEEALEDEEEDDDEGVDDDSDDNDEDDEDLEHDDDDQVTIDGSAGSGVEVEEEDEEDYSDGNETDNEAGFAESDDESDPAGDYQFWTPGRSIFASGEIEYRPAVRRTASDSSIDSLKHMSPVAHPSGLAAARPPRTRKLRIRPGTPDLPDSTDFVCGTLDEDRPLEDAYVSCMEARKRERHHMIPQDIDPTFPTSDAEENDDDDYEGGANQSEEEQVWMHGKFEDSSEDSRRRKWLPKRSPLHSPKRLRSPPPPKQRLHSPPPKQRLHSPPPPKQRLHSPPLKQRLHSPPPAGKRQVSPIPIKARLQSPTHHGLFNGTSPMRMRSPPPARMVHSPAASMISDQQTEPIPFAPLGRRPGLTHTKSLPRRPAAFCKAYREARLETALEDTSDTNDTHTRGAIDIVKGLERKRQRRKEKFYQKQCNRARKEGKAERRPLPGKGAERMKELGLHMAGKVEYRNGRAEYVLSV